MPYREFMWYSYNIKKDDEEMGEIIKSTLESLMAFMNPEAYKLYKEGQTSNTVQIGNTQIITESYINPEFNDIVKKVTGFDWDFIE